MTIIIVHSMATKVHTQSLVLKSSFCATGAAANFQEQKNDPAGLGIAVIASTFGFTYKGSSIASTGSIIRIIDVSLAFVLGLVLLLEVPHTMCIFVLCWGWVRSEGTELSVDKLEF